MLQALGFIKDLLNFATLLFPSTVAGTLLGNRSEHGIDVCDLPSTSCAADTQHDSVHQQ